MLACVLPLEMLADEWAMVYSAKKKRKKTLTKKQALRVKLEAREELLRRWKPHVSGMLRLECGLVR